MNEMTYETMTPEKAVVVDGLVHQAPTRLLRLPEVIARVGLKRSSIYQRMSEGRFPKSRSLGPKYAVCVKAEIDGWIGEVSKTIS